MKLYTPLKIKILHLAEFEETGNNKLKTEFIKNVFK